MSAASPRSGLADGIDAALDSARVVEHHGGQKYNDLERQLADALLRLFEQLEALKRDYLDMSAKWDEAREESSRLFRENLRLGEALALERSPSNPARELISDLAETSETPIPASRWPGATAFYRSVPNQERQPE